MLTYIIIHYKSLAVNSEDNVGKINSTVI